MWRPLLFLLANLFQGNESSPWCRCLFRPDGRHRQGTHGKGMFETGKQTFRLGRSPEVSGRTCQVPQRGPRTGGGLGAGLASFQLPVATSVDPTVHASRQALPAMLRPQGSVSPSWGTRPDLAFSPSLSSWVAFDQLLNLSDPAIGWAP